MKIIKPCYVVTWIFVGPALIGSSFGFLFLKVYQNFDGHWLAGLVMCLLSGLVVTWFSGGLFIIETELGFSRSSVTNVAVLAGIVQIIVSIFLLIGFPKDIAPISIGSATALILILCSTITQGQFMEKMRQFIDVEAVKRYEGPIDCDEDDT